MKKSKKTMAIVAGTLHAQFYEANTPEKLNNMKAMFEHLIDEAPVLRRVGEVQVVEEETLAELRCRVEYGPVIGAYESDLQRQLEAITDGMQQVGNMEVEGAVFDVQRREITAADAVELRARMDRLSTPFAERKRLAVALAKLSPVVGA